MPKDHHVEIALWGVALVLSIISLVLVLSVLKTPRFAGAYHPEGCIARPKKLG